MSPRKLAPEVFASVSSDEKGRYLIDNHGIPAPKFSTHAVLPSCLGSYCGLHGSVLQHLKTWLRL
ncbi:hypothetical protein BDV29DRAFT_169483 [Aspergillus leporis]|uniref:Uncharacterized protein n=1 Tax=Aspergillus leporis TaxID=41062 RepID=A0A5N5X9P7_9EURO|nr:hypothetical protein BDV29DRAFT_169483 [Aspergillus leporis]